MKLGFDPEFECNMCGETSVGFPSVGRLKLLVSDQSLGERLTKL